MTDEQHYNLIDTDAQRVFDITMTPDNQITSMEESRTYKFHDFTFTDCPACGRKQLYKRGHLERCRKCGYYRILPPGQDW